MFGRLDTNIKLGLERVERAFDVLGLDPARFRTVLVAGTNGKGSTAFYIDRILREHGFKTALFTSPHLLSVSERLKLNGEFIDEGKIYRNLSYVKNLSSKFSWDLTPFESFFVSAFLTIYDQEYDFFICEVGLGGRLDATNVLEAEVSVITTVSLDHTEFLGHTLKEIAWEKAGIIKEGAQVIIGKMEEEALKVILNVAASKNAKASIIDRDFGFRLKGRSFEGTLFDYWGERIVENVYLPLAFKSFIHNAALAVRVAEILISLDGLKVKNSLNEQIFGRGEIVNLYNKKVVLDVAHNPQALKVLLEDIKDLHKGDVTIFLSLLKDKDYESMVNIAKSFGKLYLIPQPTERGLKDGYPMNMWVSFNEAVSKVKKGKGLFVFAGSFWIVKKFKEFVESCPLSQD